MDIQAQLQELKEMYEKGLITNTVYEERQRALLASPSAPTSLSKAHHSSDLLDPKKNLISLARIALIAVVGLGLFWVVYTFSGQGTKDAMGEFASQTGIGKTAIPWEDRAEIAARKLVEQNSGQIASAIQGVTHPTGEKSSLGAVTVSKLSNRILVEIPVDWKGGFLGGQYSTRVTWEIGEQGHINAKVTADSAPARVAEQNAAQLNDYFRIKVYPAFFSDIGG